MFFSSLLFCSALYTGQRVTTTTHKPSSAFEYDNAVVASWPQMPETAVTSKSSDVVIVDDKSSGSLLFCFFPTQFRVLQAEQQPMLPAGRAAPASRCCSAAIINKSWRQKFLCSLSSRVSLWNSCVFSDTFEEKQMDSSKKEPSTASSARAKVKSRHEHNDGFLAGVAIGVASGALVLLAILGIALYRKFWYKSLHSINFDNPVYRKTTEEAVNLERDPSSVSMTSSVVTMSNSSNTGAKRSYTSNTLATDVSEVRSLNMD